MDWLLLIAILSQSLDAANTCHKLNSGNYKELNPIFGQSCGQVIAVKSSLFTPFLFTNNKGWKIGLIVGGGVGITLSIALDK